MSNKRARRTGSDVADITGASSYDLRAGSAAHTALSASPTSHVPTFAESLVNDQSRRTADFYKEVMDASADIVGPEFTDLLVVVLKGAKPYNDQLS